MFIGHIPAGYLCTSALLKAADRKNITDRQIRQLLMTGIISSILPDFDMFYFYLIDNRQHLHHGYWTHLPVFWACLFGMWFLLSRIIDRIPFGIFGTVISVNIFSHLILDTVAGDIRWLYPFSNGRWPCFMYLRFTTGGCGISCCTGHFCLNLLWWQVLCIGG